MRFFNQRNSKKNKIILIFAGAFIVASFLYGYEAMADKYWPVGWTCTSPPALDCIYYLDADSGEAITDADAIYNYLGPATSSGSQVRICLYDSTGFPRACTFGGWQQGTGTKSIGVSDPALNGSTSVQARLYVEFSINSGDTVVVGGDDATYWIREIQICGNGILQPEKGEQCDNGASNGSCPSSCSSTCTTNTCTIPKYLCSSGTCQRDDVNGTFIDDPTCNNTCASTTFYRCAGGGGCVVCSPSDGCDGVTNSWGSLTACNNSGQCVVSATYALNVNSSGASGVIISSSTGHGGTTNYSRSGIASGANVVLTAPATSGGLNFSGWTGCSSVSGTTCNRTMDANRTVSVRYTTSVCNGGIDIGLRLYQDGVRKIAVYPGNANNSKLRIFKSGFGTGYHSVVLVTPGSANASRMKVQTFAGTMALCMLP